MAKSEWTEQEWKDTVVGNMKPLVKIGVLKKTSKWYDYDGTKELAQEISRFLCGVESDWYLKKQKKKDTITPQMYEEAVFTILKNRGAKNLRMKDVGVYASSISFMCFTTVADYMEDVLSTTRLPKKFGRPRAEKWGKALLKLAVA